MEKIIKNKQKIIYASSFDISVGNGPGVNEREFITGLLQFNEYDFHFFIPKVKNNFPKDLPVDKFTFTEKLNNKNPFSLFVHHFSLYKKVSSYLKSTDIDLIIFRAGIFAFSYNKIIKRFPKIPFAMKTAGSGEFRVFNKQSPLLRSLYNLNRRLYTNLVKNASVIDVVSPMHQDLLAKITGAKDKIFFIDNGVNTDRFIITDKSITREKLGLNKFDNILGYAGNLPWERGGMQIIEAIPLLIKKYPNLGGVILGSGSGMETLYDKARQLGIEDRVVFTGQVPFDSVVEYINSFDIGVSQLYEESQGASEQKVRQYLGCGKLVIVSPGSVNNFVEKQNFGFIADPYNINDFAEKTDKLLSYTPEVKNEMAKRIRKYAIDNLSIKSKIEQRINLYKKYILTK